MDALVDALRTNDTLLSLNLNNTGLDATCSKRIREMMEINQTLIKYIPTHSAWTSITTHK